MALLYALNMYSIISETVAMQKIEVQTMALEGSMDKLDAQYMAISNKITPDIAKEYGLEQGNVSTYIPRTRSIGSANGVATEL